MSKNNMSKEGLYGYRKYLNLEKATCLLKDLRKATRNKHWLIEKPVGQIVILLGHLLSALENPALPGEEKILIFAAIGYIVLPFDIIPDSLPVIGFSDDVAAVGWVVSKIKNYSTFSLAELDKKIDQEK